MSVPVIQSAIDECVGNAHGNLARVQQLVDLHPGIVNARATWNETPIEAATQLGHRPIIEFLLQRGAPIDFFTACVLGSSEAVQAELKANPNRARDRGVHDLPPLYFAAIGGSLVVADQLLAAGADVNQRADAAGPLHGAVMGGSPAMIRWLLERGADPEAPDYQGRSARSLAVAMNRDDLARLF